MQGILDNYPIFLTGAAGFIGSYLARRLLKKGLRVVGFDNFNDYYDPRLKEYRLGLIEEAAKESKGSWQFVMVADWFGLAK